MHFHLLFFYINSQDWARNTVCLCCAMNTQIVYELNNNKARNVNEIVDFVEMEKFTKFARLFTPKKRNSMAKCVRLFVIIIDRIEQNELCDFDYLRSQTHADYHYYYYYYWMTKSGNNVKQQSNCLI